MAITFSFLDTNTALTERRRLKLFIDGIFKRNRRRIGNLSYVFCTDDYLLVVNQRFLNHGYYTDIITFDLSGSPKIIEGEVYISIDRVKENARLLGVTQKEELHRVMFHGALHLCGYRDKRPQEKKIMRLEEDKALRRYFR